MSCGPVLTSEILHRYFCAPLPTRHDCRAGSANFLRNTPHQKWERMREVGANRNTNCTFSLASQKSRLRLRKQTRKKRVM